jgi:hypothetical protein
MHVPVLPFTRSTAMWSKMYHYLIQTGKNLLPTPIEIEDETMA